MNGEQENATASGNANPQPKPQPQAPAPKTGAKRPRRSIEDELAALEAKKAALLEKKRRMQAREKIILGALAAKYYTAANPQAREALRQWYIKQAAEKDRGTVRGIFARLDELKGPGK